MVSAQDSYPPRRTAVRFCSPLHSREACLSFLFLDISLFMFTVYVLYSEKFNKIYIGYTSNLEERLLSHNKLGTKGWTIRYRPWKIIYTEEYNSKSEALKREK